MLKLTRSTLVVASALAQTLAISLPVAADECGCTRAQCKGNGTCETSSYDSACFWEQTAAIVGKVIALASYDQLPLKQVDAPVAERVHPDAPAEMVCYDILIFTHPHGSRVEFDELPQEGDMVVADAKSFLPMVQMLEKDRLISIVSRPRWMAKLGHHGTLSMGERAERNGKDIGHWLELSLSAERVDDKLAVKLDLMKKHAGHRYQVQLDKVLVEEGEVLIVRTHGEKINAEAPELSPTYLLVTPSISDPATLKRAKVYRAAAASPSTTPPNKD